MHENKIEEAESIEQEKAEAFVKEYGELVAKHGYDFTSYPTLVPDGTPGGFKIFMAQHVVPTNDDIIPSK